MVKPKLNQPTPGPGGGRSVRPEVKGLRQKSLVRASGEREGKGGNNHVPRARQPFTLSPMYVLEKMLMLRRGKATPKKGPEVKTGENWHKSQEDGRDGGEPRIGGA